MAINDKLIRLVKITITDTEYKIIISDQTLYKLIVRKGLRHDGQLTAILFNIVLDAIARGSRM